MSLKHTMDFRLLHQPDEVGLHSLRNEMSALPDQPTVELREQARCLFETLVRDMMASLSKNIGQQFDNSLLTAPDAVFVRDNENCLQLA